MARAYGSFAALAVVTVLTGLFTACSVLVGTGGLSGEASSGGSGDASSSPDALVNGTDAGSPLPSSCRALHASSPDAGSDAYKLAGPDGGVLDTYCDMESFGGGWTRVTPAMIVEDKAVQDYAPSSPAHVDVVRGTDAHGGAFFTLTITAVNCGANQNGGGPGHYFLVGDLDHWTQIMATYEFSQSSSCWDIFGNPKPRDTNVVPFDLTKDLIGPQLNMSRSDAGAPIPFDGRLQACDENADNFWGSPYETAPKGARVVLRRFSQDKPAGLGIGTDCGLAGWKVTDIHVR